MQVREPDFWRNLRAELASGRPWIDRAVVLAYAAATGLVVVGFTHLAELASAGFERLRHAGAAGPWLPLLWTPALTVALLWWTQRFAPGALGSGIPQVVLALDEQTPAAQRGGLVSLRLALQKIALVSGGLLAGLSIGREGPTVQVGAGVMQHARRWLSPHSGIDAHDLMVAGAAAGIAAAFNTPLGGVIFALEQLSRRRSSSHSALVIVCIVLSGLVAVSAFGNHSYFGQLRVQQLEWSLLGPGLLVALAAGLAGGLFSRLIVASVRGLPDRYSRWRGRYPLRFAAGCAVLVAAIGVVTGGATAGAGYAPTRALLEGQAGLPAFYTLLKFCATWLSAWTGVAAGVFAPSLAIGAGIGHDIAWLAGVSGEAAIPLIALGMVGFLAATTQGPITAFIIVMEMVAGHTMVLSLMATALLASAVARLLTRPMYLELAGLLTPTPRPANPLTTAARAGRYPRRMLSVEPPPALFSFRPFMRFWYGRLAGTMGNQMLMVAVGWQMYGLTGSAWDLGLVGLYQFLPALLLVLVAGHAADRYERRLILALCMTLQVAVALALMVAAHEQWASRGLLLGLSIAIGCAKAFQMPSQQAIVPLLVPDAVLPRALAFSSAGMQAAIIGGPALGGFVFVAGAPVVYGLCALLFAIATALFVGVRHAEVPRSTEPVRLSTVLAGVNFIRHRPVVLGAISLDLFAVLLGGATALLPMFAKDVLHVGPWGLGLLRAVPAVGALAMSIALSRWPITRRVGPRMFVAVAVYGVSQLAFGLSTWFWLSLLALGVSGAADMVSVVIRQSLVQLETPNEMRGRVSAVNSIFIGASNQLGEFESGATAAWLGPVGSVVLGGIGTLAVALAWMKLFPDLARRERLRG